MPSWKYEPGEHRYKHCGRDDFPSIQRDGSQVVGKCPKTLSKAEAEVLLNDGEYIGKDLGNQSPDRIWNVHHGVIYEAVPTQGGSYHGYPWYARPGMNHLPRKILRALEQKAREQGYEREFWGWIKRHG